MIVISAKMSKILFGCLRCPANIMGWGDCPYCGKGLLTQVPNGKCHGRQIIRYPNFLPIFIQKHHQSILSKTKIWSWKHLHKRLHSLLLPPEQNPRVSWPSGLWSLRLRGLAPLSLLHPLYPLSVSKTDLSPAKYCSLCSLAEITPCVPFLHKKGFLSHLLRL